MARMPKHGNDGMAAGRTLTAASCSAFIETALACKCCLIGAANNIMQQLHNICTYVVRAHCWHTKGLVSGCHIL